MVITLPFFVGSIDGTGKEGVFLAVGVSSQLEEKKGAQSVPVRHFRRSLMY